MPEEPIVGEEHEGERPRPRVVDKRVSARAAEPSEQAPRTPSEPLPQQESPVEPPDASGTPESAPTDAGVPWAGDPGADVWTPEQEAQARAIAEEIAGRPGIEWVANTAVSLANIAATKLDLGSPADAQLVIDALAGIIKEVGPRLGNVEQPLRQTLAQLQMAYAERVTNLQQQPPGG